MVHGNGYVSVNYMNFNDLAKNIPGLKGATVGVPTNAALSLLASRFPGKIAFSSSLGLEDQVVTHMIRENSIPIRIFTLDTGRLFPETYYTQYLTNIEYNFKMETFFPDWKKVEELCNSKGPCSFYESVENRKECCFIRKVEPLRRALQGVELWVTGIRREQAESRNALEMLEWDNSNHCIKFHPLLDWSFGEVWDYIKKYKIPYNELHDKGYPSIGCAPCTRAIKSGEDIRSGRWWWEKEGGKECGLHYGGARPEDPPSEGLHHDKEKNSQGREEIPSSKENKK